MLFNECIFVLVRLDTCKFQSKTIVNSITECKFFSVVILCSAQVNTKSKRVISHNQEMRICRCRFTRWPIELGKPSSFISFNASECNLQTDCRWGWFVRLQRLKGRRKKAAVRLALSQQWSSRESNGRHRRESSPVTTPIAQCKVCGGYRMWYEPPAWQQ